MKSFTSRTTLLTTLAVAGVLTAGTAAIAANIGILNSTTDSSIGSLSASDDLLGSAAGTSSTVVVDPAGTAMGGTYVVDDAGTVAVTAAGDRIGLRSAEPNPGWALTSSQPDPQTLTVTFSNGNRTVVFLATIDAQGLVVADVTEPSEVTGSPSTTMAGSTDDHDNDDRTDDHDSDDDHQYEGADDDD